MDKKEQIYQAALKLFNQNGFDKTPTSQIASEAGVATGTLFHYFKTKEELINSLYLRCKDSMVARMLEGVDSEKTLRSKLRIMYFNSINWGVTCTDEFYFFQQFSNSPYIHAVTHNEGKNKINAVIELVVEGIREEVFKNVDVEYIVTIITGMLFTNILYFTKYPEQMQNQEFLDETFKFIWNSIKS